MKLYFMKKEALDILKSNLDMVYNMYFTEKDNKWLWKVCGGDPFVEFRRYKISSWHRLILICQKVKLSLQTVRLYINTCHF